MLQIIALLAGIWIIFYLNQAYKTFGHSFIRKLVWVSVFINLWLLLSFTSKYINLNVTYFYSQTKISWGYIIRHPLSTIAFSGGFLILLSVVMELSGYPGFVKAASRLKNIFLFAVISYIGGFIIYYYYPETELLGYIDKILLNGGNLVVYISLALLALTNRQEEKKKPTIRMFALTYAIVFLPIGAFMFAIPLKLTILSMLFVLSNAAPFFWINRYFIKYFAEQVEFNDSSTTLDRTVEKYGLTKREFEIMELILRGKSNKEIESELFISLNTVRNHTHNLYKKLGVNGRGQMVGLILTSSKETPLQ